MIRKRGWVERGWGAKEQERTGKERAQSSSISNKITPRIVIHAMRNPTPDVNDWREVTGKQREKK